MHGTGAVTASTHLIYKVGGGGRREEREEKKKGKRGEDGTRKLLVLA